MLTFPEGAATGAAAEGAEVGAAVGVIVGVMVRVVVGGVVVAPVGLFVGGRGPGSNNVGYKRARHRNPRGEKILLDLIQVRVDEF